MYKLAYQLTYTLTKLPDKLSKFFFKVELKNFKELTGISAFLPNVVFAPDLNKILNFADLNTTLLSNEKLILPFYQQISDKYGENSIQIETKQENNKYYCWLSLGKKELIINHRYPLTRVVEFINSFDSGNQPSINLGFIRKNNKEVLLGLKQTFPNLKRYLTDLDKAALFAPNLLEQLNNTSKKTVTIIDNLLARFFYDDQKQTIFIKSFIKKNKLPTKFLHLVSFNINKEAGHNGRVSAWHIYLGFNSTIQQNNVSLSWQQKEKFMKQLITELCQ